MTVDALLDFDPTKIYNKVVTKGNEWAERKAEAQYLEEAGKVLLAVITSELTNKMSATQATSTAKADERWQTHIEGLRVAQMASYKAQVDYEGAKGWRDDLRTKIVTMRDVAKIR